jgi:Resolvase, N terminal domain
MDRPSLQQMLRAALSPAKPFDIILVDDTSRLSRSTESVLSIYRRLNFAGLQLISVSQGIDSRQDQAETLLTIHGLIDSSYVSSGSCGTPKKKSARLTDSLQAVARRQRKRPDPGSGLLNQQMVAGVRFELTTFGL